ncbi:MAG: 8-oxoguanine deaminase [Candidatus Wallbacteria bacterium GWC2_49_35]|uniref:8-oxoguanine deaminase n=1 Tax=Candidatus Wallbacteria bacterium GWC2_49_35 TaxID=1817813 RepID=A0A1F7WJF4_9BACT|nr:MAG: 8-oxoguanine deaminase [Candidatus Wallbacteria bacterium GWC2_49_35]HBC76701.1 8-oxoguanine deaminase [Candidatus Wallbacteria bacterium]
MTKGIIIKNAYAMALLDAKNTVLKDASLLIEGNEIKKIYTKEESGEIENLAASGEYKLIDAAHNLVLPGFVNTHHHFYQIFTRNIPKMQDEKLFDWLIDLYDVWALLDEEWVRWSTLAALGELALTGCTATTDHHYVFPKGGERFIDTQFAAAEQIGMRFHATRGSMSRSKKDGGLPPDSVVQTEEDIMLDCERLINKYHDTSKHSMRKVALAPCSPFSVTPKLLEETAKFARTKKVKMHTHLCETNDEDDYCLKVYKLRPVDFMESVGWLGPDVWFAHSIYVNDAEIERMGKLGTGVAHCPSSNLRLGSGIAPVPKMLAHGVPVGIAVDGSASNDSSDMLGELRMALLVHRVGTGVSSMPAFDVFKMGCQHGARILDFNTSGEIAAGKAADIIMYDLDSIGYVGALHDPLSSILFAGFNHRVNYNITNGKIIVEKGVLKTFDERSIVENGNRIAERIVNRKYIDIKR